MAAKAELMTNEWIPADGNKWPGREVLVRWNDDSKEVAVFNHFYWVSQDGHRLNETVGRKITHFYIFEKFNENEIL